MFVGLMGGVFGPFFTDRSHAEVMWWLWWACGWCLAGLTCSLLSKARGELY